MLSRAERSSGSRAILGVAAAAAALTGLAIVALDRPLATAIGEYAPSRWWNATLELLEIAIAYPVHPLASAIAVAAFMLLAIAVPRLRPAAPMAILVAGTHIFSRYAVNELKELTGRLRPIQWVEKGGDTFFRDGISFPSGHVALFASLLIPLAMRWPVVRIPAAIVIAFVASARMAVNAHFLSDTLGAVTVVALVAWVLALGVRPFARPR